MILRTIGASLLNINGGILVVDLALSARKPAYVEYPFSWGASSADTSFLPSPKVFNISGIGSFPDAVISAFDNLLK